MPMIERRQGRLLRIVMRAPTWLFRARLGRLLGNRFVYVVHRGRKTGLSRSTVLETIRYRRGTGEVVVVSGWGEKAQWYRNVLTSGADEVRVGAHRYVRPEQRQLSPQETVELLDEYVRQHPLAARLLESISSWRFRQVQQRERIAQELPALAFTPRSSAAFGRSTESLPSARQ